ncbi:hypothetical protein DRJ48_03290 [Candidatus Woesearchaeota archaeon]|nr:hypothetical protein [Candidatus Woesearchaeota archaeon]RLE42570.1 MAG: hypothetical protein DRJ48_03290 [Candidatus Woesearchaeota archaeon]
MPKEKEIEIDLTKIVSFFKKRRGKGAKPARLQALNQSWVVLTVLVLIPFVLAFVIRMAPASLPITEEWARDAVYSNIKNSIMDDINKQHPNLPQYQKQELLQDMFENFLRNKGKEIEASIQKTSEYFKGQLKNPNGYTYLLAIDPYAYFRRARNIIEKGHMWDTLKDGVPWNDHMVAPLGVKMSFNLHPYIIAYWYKLLRVFGFKDLMGAAFFIPIIFSALAVVPAFFLGRRFAGNVGGFVAAVMVAVATPFISRTSGGFVDTDAYNVLFPLLISWLFIEAMERETLKSKITLSALAGLSVGIFSLIWEWWFIFDLIVAVILSFFGFNLLRNLVTKQGLNFEKHVINNVYTSVMFVLVSGVTVTIFKSFSEFISGAFSNPISYYYLKAVAVFKVWPNVMTTVAEQNALSVSKVISTMGGPISFFISILGIFLIAFDLRKLTKNDYYFLFGGGVWLLLVVLIFQPTNAMAFDLLVALPFIARYINLLRTKERVNIEFSVLCLIWFVITFFASVRGVRFTLLLVPIYALGFGVAIGKLLVLLERFFTSSLGIERTLSRPLLYVGVLVILISPTLAGYRTATHEIPSMNDAWYQALEKIRQESAPDAIINSWWDFGHWFKAIADRAVTFDGASQNTPMAHWIGLSLLTSDEATTVGILRMLDCGSNTAFEVLNKELRDTPKSVDLLYKIIRVDKQEAATILANNGVSSETTNEVLKYTHCNPPEDYYITSDDMIGKSGVWAHFGSWDFVKASMYRDVIKLRERTKGIELLKTKYNLSEEDAMRYYYEIKSTDADDWIAPWPSYASRKYTCQTQGRKLICPHNVGKGNIIPFEIDLENMTAFVSTTTGKVYPNTFVYPTKDGYAVKEYKGETIGLSLTLIPPTSVGGKYASVLLAPELAQSTFHKLFFYEGHGMKCFELFDHRTQFTGGDIYVWKVDWSCNQNNTIFG